MKRVGLLSNYQICTCAFSAQYLKTCSRWKDLENKWMRLSRWRMVKENYGLLNAVVFKRKFVRQIWVYFFGIWIALQLFFASAEKWGINRTWSRFAHKLFLSITSHEEIGVKTGLFPRVKPALSEVKKIWAIFLLRLMIFKVAWSDV